MVQKIGPEENSVTLKFGGGLHTRASPDEIQGQEAAGGFNFLIDIDNRNLRNRQPFDLIGTAPNAGSIRGAGSLLKTDGTVTTIFQAGNKVYSWNGHSTFTQVGTCSATCQLRGHWQSHTWNLTDKLLVTDLNLTDTVYQWDGTALTTVVFTDQLGNPFGNFYAKYCNIINERALFANVKDGSGALPHMMVGCKQSNFNEITVVNAPSSSLGAADPFFMLTPDLKPVNGIIASFLGTMLSSQQGMIFSLTGTDATNFNFVPFYSASNAVGYESLCEIGNDFIYGRPGRIESVRDTNSYGNSQSSDLTAIVSDQIATFTGWTIVFNSRIRKVYCLPIGVSQCWVLDPAIRDANQISPWMRWETSHSLAYQPTMMMSLLDPADGLEYVFMGDSSGNIYRMEGTGSGGDGGTNTIDMQFLSKLIPARLDSKLYDVEGYIKYQQNLSGNVTLTFQYQGENIFNNSITIPLSTASTGNYYSGAGSYYNTPGVVYNSFTGKMTRNKFTIPGNANEFQVLVEVTGNNAFSINEIGIRFRASSQ